MRILLSKVARSIRQERGFGVIIRLGVGIMAREGLGGLKRRALRLAGFFGPVTEPSQSLTPTYEAWVARFGSLRPEDIAAARRHLATLTLPDVLILAFVGREQIPVLGRMLASWQSSIHTAWRAALLCPPDLSDAEREAVDAAAAADARVFVAQDAAALEVARPAPTLLLLSYGGVRLNPLSLYMLAEAASRTGADVVYADHDAVNAAGARSHPAFKPQFSADYASRHNYLGDCLLLSPAAIPDGAARPNLFDLSPAAFDRWVSDLVVDRAVAHLPFVLSHVEHPRASAPFERAAAPDQGPHVSIIIPTRDGLDVLKPCIDSIRGQTTYDLALVEIIVVDNGSCDPAALAFLHDLGEQPDATVLRYPGAFNFASINNLGAAQSRADILVFLNNDTTVHDPRWLSKLVAEAQRPGIGVVGAKLLFPDGTIQHGGCVAGGNDGTVSHLLLEADPATVDADDHTREISLVTGACCAIRRSVFEAIGGFDPILRVTWNDVKLCLACLEAGYRNIYIADPLLIHHEQKTRGREDTPDKIERYFAEGNYTRRRYRRYFFDDPSYNPNRSVQGQTTYAEPPRVRRPWAGRESGIGRILVLSSVYKFGFGVAVVIQQQVLRLRQLGYEVVIGGPPRDNELAFPGCARVLFTSSREAAAWAFDNDVDLIISHTPPFFNIPSFIGGHIAVLAYDYGEPPTTAFPEPVQSYLVGVARQKRSAAPLTTRIATISQAVKDETLNDDATVLGLANSHLPRWSVDLRARRDAIRRELGWENRFVVLTVCRFGVNERAYKGIDALAALAREFPFLHPERADTLVWALAGAGEPDDIRFVEKLGLTVFPNVPDSRLTDLYAAADAYLSFSRWEGYNLGISQALAMGLPIAASDIPAHREFPIFTSNSTLALAAWLAGEVKLSGDRNRTRSATVYEWSNSVDAFCRVVGEVLAERRLTYRPAAPQAAPAPPVPALVDT